MIQRIPFIMLLLACLSAKAAERITLLITVTNVPVTGNTLTINSSIRTWTNANSASTILTNLVSTNHATTNLYTQIATYPYSGGIIQQWVSSNSFRLIGAFGGALSGLQTGNWAALVLSTQSGPSTFTALYPMENIVGETNRTNQGSSLVYGMDIYSTNAFRTNSTAVSNLLQKGAGPLQVVAGPVHFSGSNTIGALGRMTNGLWTNGILLAPKFTNAVNYGNALSSPGTGTGSQQFGNAASATGQQSLAVGASAAALGDYGVAVGNSASSGTNAGSIAIGSSATAIHVGDARHAADGIAIGTSSRVSATNAIAIGSSADADFADSVAIGTSASATTTNQIVLGASTHTVSIPGVVAIEGTQTNTTFTGTNVIRGRVDFTSRANTGLANGTTVGVVLGTNVYVRLSGATTIAAIGGFAAEQDGSFHIIQITGAITNIFYNDSTDPTVGNRIVTGTGADLALTNNPTCIGVIYDGTASRWRLVSFFR